MTFVARDLMQPDPLTVPATMSYLDLQHVLVAAQVSGAAVVDESGGVVGVVSATDLLRAADEALDDDRDPGESDNLAERFEMLTAGDLATPEVVWVSPRTPIARVAQRMRSVGIHRVLVGERGKLQGILTAYDLLKAVA